MGLAKNALDPASVTGRTQPFRRKRQRASGYAPGTWLSLLCRGVAVSPRRGGPQSEEDEWVEFARGDAETQRSLLCVLFSPRLRVSASLREMAFVLASWSFCFTAVWGAAIGGG